MKWFVVAARAGYEDMACRTLIERISQNKQNDFFGQVVVPTEIVVEMRNGKRRTSKRKFFPGYVLVQMELNDDTWHLVRGTPQIMGFIGGSSDHPEALCEKEADDILSRIQSGIEKPRMRSMLEPGEMIRIIDGPFSDFSAVVEEVNYEKNKLRVSVSVLGRSTPLELALNQVEKN